MASTAQSLVAFLRIGAQLLAPLRRVPGVELLRRYIDHAWFNPIATKLIRDSRDPDLASALELYRKRIPDDQRFEAADIISWIREDLIARKHPIATAPTDWFVVAVYRRRVCGFVLFHYYPSIQAAFFAYMVVALTPGIPVDAVSNSLCAHVSRMLKSRRELRGCRAIVMEVEDPRKELARRARDECLARLRRFCTLAEMQGYSLRAFDFDYKQPKLSTEDPDGSERALLLLSAATQASSTDGSAGQRRQELAKLLGFIYTSIYPEGYSTDPEELGLYRQYCERLREQEISGLPQIVRSLSLKQVFAHVRRLRSFEGSD